METIDVRTEIEQDFVPQAVIIADGDFPSHPIPCALLRKAKFVACCDGAVNEYVLRGGVPNLIVGDGDSISEENREKFADIIVKIEDQETNDLTKTINQLKQRGFVSIAILGATGKREDHTLGNISLLLEYKSMGLDVRMMTDYGTFIPAEDICGFSSFYRQQISIFNFGATGMKADGLQYPISDFTSWWQGTLNQAEDDSFTIQAKGKYIVFLTHEKK